MIARRQPLNPGTTMRLPNAPQEPFAGNRGSGQPIVGMPPEPHQPGPGSIGGGLGGPGPAGNPQRPNERPGGGMPQGPLVTPRSNATPSMPQEPTPVASQPPQPFQPMASPVLRRGSLGGAPEQNAALLGKAGGLLGGGLNVPDVTTDGSGGTDLADLIAKLYTFANR